MKEFYVDNCCTWRAKLQSVFGPHLKVSLDIFHAVKRIGEKIPKRHELRVSCMQELRMVFRQPSDKGIERTMTTRASGTYTQTCFALVWLLMYEPLTCNSTIDVIAEQMQVFQSCCTAKESSTGEKFLSDAALKENKYFELKNSWGCRPNSNYLLN